MRAGEWKSCPCRTAMSNDGVATGTGAVGAEPSGKSRMSAYPVAGSDHVCRGVACPPSIRGRRTKHVQDGAGRTGGKSVRLTGQRGTPGHRQRPTIIASDTRKGRADSTGTTHKASTLYRMPLPKSSSPGCPRQDAPTVSFPCRFRGSIIAPAAQPRPTKMRPRARPTLYCPTRSADHWAMPLRASCTKRDRRTPSRNRPPTIRPTMPTGRLNWMSSTMRVSSVSFSTS